MSIREWNKDFFWLSASKSKRNKMRPRQLIALILKRLWVCYFYHISRHSTSTVVCIFPILYDYLCKDISSDRSGPVPKNKLVSLDLGIVIFFSEWIDQWSRRSSYPSGGKIEKEKELYCFYKYFFRSSSPCAEKTFLKKLNKDIFHSLYLTFISNIRSFIPASFL